MENRVGCGWGIIIHAVFIIIQKDTKNKENLCLKETKYFHYYQNFIMGILREAAKKVLLLMGGPLSPNFGTLEKKVKEKLFFP